MSHDISGHNKAGEEIAYARFSMWNGNASILYYLLDAMDYYAGVSGSGGSCNFSISQMEEALKTYNQTYNGYSLLEGDMDLKQIKNFLQNCYEVSQKEGSVKVFFG